jgi:type II secretory pathway pseudopilin PulG
LANRPQSSAYRLAAGKGYSMVELVITLAVIMVLVAIAIPSLTHIFAVYQLNDAANRLASQLKFTRYEAIRLNKQVNGVILATGTDWVVFADTIKNGVPDPTETQDLITGAVTLLPGAGLPDPGPITAQLGASGLAVGVLSGANASVTFDQRGAVVGPNNSTVYVLYLGNPANATLGYRAVVLLPSGMVHVWTAGQGGVWQQVS